MIPDLKKKFAGIQKDHSPEPRPFYCHFTSVIDTRSTKLILLSGRPWFSLNAFWCWAHAFPSSPRHDFTSQFEKELLNGMSRTKPLLSAGHILMACVIVTVVNTRYSFHLLTILRASSHGPPQRNGLFYYQLMSHCRSSPDFHHCILRRRLCCTNLYWQYSKMVIYVTYITSHYKAHEWLSRNGVDIST